ncbi:ADP-ribosylglycohydrolase family protein [Shinella sp.]|uniref:ADP-ribosylglycohydrolase family protein n=1 Tax=Shinella sp. TaxID=1870904 RepID=UPI00258A50AD|nr:ADP-ribosylglycohydrolase family protein [Shinella sp.]MCW5710665.1 ADP-ribosylglycohydrolase family protein [Shinella sp.]
MNVNDRICGGLAGAVIGDALGALTETLSIRQIEEIYGWLDDFTELKHKPYDQNRVVGAYTDDASLVIAICKAAIEPQGFCIDTIVSKLLEWSEDPNLAKFAGPSTKRAVSRILAGENPRLVGMGDVQSFTGLSNGGAMKAPPAGWLYPGDIAASARAAALICEPTHNTQIAISGAAAIGAACSMAMLDGATVEAVAEAAVEGSRLGERIGMEQGREVAGPSVPRRIEQAIRIANSGHGLRTILLNLADEIGAGLNTYESVPAAIGVFVAVAGDVNAAAIASANIGDDTDTVGCMAAAIAGTFTGIQGVNPRWMELVSQVNALDLPDLAARLAATHKK